MIIRIKNLKLTTIIGVYEWEEKEPRTLLFNVEIETNLTDGMKSDHLKDVIDYDVVVKQIKTLVENNRFNLIEKMVDQVLDVIMQDQRIKRCTIEVDKMKVYDFIDSFSITETRFN
jgi:D-erythro-7,8-dihydroneopterin triphosphate epimerase